MSDETSSTAPHVDQAAAQTLGFDLTQTDRLDMIYAIGRMIAMGKVQPQEVSNLLAERGKRIASLRHELSTLGGLPEAPRAVKQAAPVRKAVTQARMPFRPQDAKKATAAIHAAGLITAADAAKLIGTTVHNVDNVVGRGRLAVVKTFFGMHAFRSADVQAYIINRKGK